MTDRIQKLLTMARPLVIAHRGFSQVAPENTEPAFRLALQASPDLVELDYYHSADGVPVVFHDRTTGRTTDAAAVFGRADIPIAAKRWEELRRLDAGSWFGPGFAGTRLLRLEEALDVIQPGAVTLIEHKAGDAATLHGLLQAQGLLGEVVVQSFEWDFLTDFHALAPEVPLGALGPPQFWEGHRLNEDERALSEAWLDRMAATGASVAAWNTRVDRAAVAAAADRGIKVWSYVINDVDTAGQMLAAGVNGLIGDNPALLWKALAVNKPAE